MWGKPPFSIPDNYAVDVGNLADASAWYKMKLVLREAQTGRVEDSGRPFIDLQISKDSPILSLVQLDPNLSAKSPHVVFYCKNIEKAHQWLAERGITVDPTSTDSGGNRFFRFHDLDGNAIEVCVEPG